MRTAEQRFERLRTSPIYWYQKACELKAASEVLESSTNPGSVSELLRGLSLELLLKAIILARSGVTPAVHDLNHLARTAGLEVDPTEVDFLDLLSASTVWVGRYPVPKQFEDMERRSMALDRTRYEPLKPGAKLRGRKPVPGTVRKHFEQWWGMAEALFQQLTGENS